MTSEVVEIRCPVGPRRLLSKLLLSGDKPHITNDNLLEFACSDCRRALKLEGVYVDIVLHRYSLDGQLVESVTH